MGLVGPDDPATVDALHFLASHQASNGGFLNQDGQYNANTAGVAAQAFAAGGLEKELARAQSFLAGLQMDCSFAPALRGGIAFTAADRATLAKTSTEAKALDRALRATPQATLGLAGGSLLTVTADGASSTAPTLSCPAPSPTTATSSTTTPTTSTASSTTTSSTSAATTPSSIDGGNGSANAPASATPSALAFTGADISAYVIAGLLLLVAGVGALVLARRKGVHA